MGGIGSGGSGRKFHFQPAIDRDEYDRQPGETDKAWNAFTIYRDLGLSRTHVKTREILGKTTGYARVIEEWSSKWGWKVRIEAWDREKDRVARRAELAEVEEMRKRHIQLATNLIGLGAVELNKLIKLVRQNVENNELSAIEVLKVIEAGIKLERATRGEPDSITKTTHEFGVDDERRMLRGVLHDEEAMKAVDDLMKAINAGGAKKRR